MYLVHVLGKRTRNYNQETKICLERFFSPISDQYGTIKYSLCPLSVLTMETNARWLFNVCIDDRFSKYGPQMSSIAWNITGNKN